MHGQIPSRHLAAILVADLVGYSRLVGIDEAGTLRRLRALRRELLDPAIASADGRVVKSTGDGIIAEFPSSVRAVSCAVTIQKAMAARSTGELTDRALQLRIGINLGDVIVEPDGDIFGDGVNVAARLEPLSDAGGLCISRSVYEQVRDKLSYPFEDRGDQELKNISRPVGVYAIGPAVVAGLGEDDGDLASGPGGVARARGRVRATVVLGLTGLVGAGGLVWWSWRSVPASAPIPPLPAQMAVDARPVPRLSIVVLPFSNLSDEQGQEFLAESITTDLTTDLSRISGSFVIASGTALSYKGRSPDVRQVGRDLGVRYVLAGSVRRIGDLIRVNAQLADAATGAQVWSDRFEGSRAAFADLQDELIARLARTLDLELTEAESRRAEKERPGNLDAGDVALRAWSVLNRPVSKAQLVEAQGLFEQALRLDPRLTSARIGLARTLANKVNIRVSDTNEADLARAEALNDDVLAAHPTDAMAHFVKADILRGRKQFTAAVAGYQTAIALNRNFAPAYGAMASALLRAGRSPEAIPQVDHAVRLSPRDPLLGFWLYIKGHAYAHLARDEDAIVWCLKSLAVSATPYWLNYVDLASSYAWMGRPDEARAAVDALLRLKPGYTVSQWRREGWSDDPVFLREYQRIVEGLRKAGLPET